jgi:hypothetical protein
MTDFRAGQKVRCVKRGGWNTDGPAYGEVVTVDESTTVSAVCRERIGRAVPVHEQVLLLSEWPPGYYPAKYFRPLDDTSDAAHRTAQKHFGKHLLKEPEKADG